MASDATESFDIYKLWAWFETNKKQVTIGAVIVVVGALIGWYVYWQQQARRTAADEALSDLVLAASLGAQRPTADTYLHLAAKYPGTGAGSRALIMAGTEYFVDGNYSQALAQFEKFRREYRDSPLIPQALTGIATCLNAQGKANEAIEAYQDLIRHHGSESVILQAKVALADLYDRQQKPDLATPLLADVARDESAGSLASVAALRLGETRMKYSSQAIQAPTPVTPPKFTIEKQ